jgi:DNA-binding transcriptional LysR family regulator
MHHDASLNIRQLQVFEAVARLESYSRAQQELGISVSAISNAMSQLEGQLASPSASAGAAAFP